MNETLSNRELEQIDYNLSQVYLIQYMMRKGIIKTFEEYATKFAAVFEMLANGSIEYAEPDWDKIRSEVKTLTKQV